MGSAGEGGVDLALLCDGLKAEREQGITIDVAYRYFTTAKRKFIIADTPGHEQYTRNMITGGSNCDIAILLVDARKGILTQTKRHSFIVALLRIPHIIVAINKMDLVDYDQEIYDRIREEYASFAAKLELQDVRFIPISALKGDNIVDRTDTMRWYNGGTLLEYLETVHIASDRNLIDFRFPVQYVVRPDLNFRGYAGTIVSGVVRPGDNVVVLPSHSRSRIKDIVTFEGNLEEAFAPQSVVLTLENEIDISRGDIIVHPGNIPEGTREFEAMIVWMSEELLRKGQLNYWVRSISGNVSGMISELRFRVRCEFSAQRKSRYPKTQ